MAHKKQNARRTINRNDRRSTSHLSLDIDLDEQLVAPPIRSAPPPLEAKTPNQAKYIKAINSNVLTFGVGPAGVGKSFIVGCIAAELLRKKQIEKIILTRPSVESGRGLGFIPGELSDKFAPYVAPFREILEERLGKSTVEYMLKTGKIDPRPLEYMRGSTFKNAFVVFDEAQNATPAEMKMFLTRIGEDCTVVVNGDVKQKDIHGMSGLEDALNRVGDLPSVRVVQFGKEDIVRSGLVAQIVERYED